MKTETGAESGAWDSRALGTEHPLFGQLVREVASITTWQLESALREQQEEGGRLGEILVRRGLLRPDQILETLELQAQHVTRMRQADFPRGLPLPIYLSVCFPCFNEADVLKSNLDAACAILPYFVDRFEVVVVNDGSRDATGRIADHYASQEPRVTVVHHEANRGYGAAVTSGMRAAAGDFVMFTDGDGQFSMLDLPQLLVHLDAADVVVGFRHNRVEGRLRKLNAWSWNRLIRLVLGVHIRDLDCAYKVFPRAIVNQLQMTATGACINAEIMAQVARGGLRVIETPVGHFPRYHGAPTGANFKVIARAFRELPQLWRYRTLNTLTAASAAPAAPSTQEAAPPVHSDAGALTDAQDAAER